MDHNLQYSARSIIQKDGTLMLMSKKVDYYNTNYILRGLPLPAGKHTVKFVFEPESVKQGRSIMFIASILIPILLGGLFMAWKQSKKTS